MSTAKVGESYKRASLEADPDVVVIGSGIGGLTVAALLARLAGRRVLVLERHYVVGGYTHTFRRPGYEWDVGLHYVGGRVGEPGSEIRRMFDQVTDGTLEWAPMPDVYDRVIVGDDTYDFVRGRERLRARLKAYFPAEGAAIDGYLAHVEATIRASRLYFVDKALPALVSRLVGPLLRSRFLAYADRTTRQVLESVTANEKLIGVLTGQFLTYGLPPGESSFAMHAIIADHYLDGGWYPVGGASRIAASIAPVIERAGGRILVSAEVAEIAVEGGRAVGVRMADGRTIRSKLVISDAGVVNTFGRLLPRRTARRHRLDRCLAEVEPSPSMLALYVGLRRSDRELGLQGTNLWIHSGYDHDSAIAASRKDPAAPLPLAYVSFPSAKDPTFQSRFPGKSTIEVLAFAPYDWFRRWERTSWKRRGEGYEELKASLARRLVEQLYRHVPQTRGHVDHLELSTPLTNRHFANWAAGEPYGINHTPRRFRQRWLRSATPVRRLFLTGQDALVEGLVGGLFSGFTTASAILRRPLVSIWPPREATAGAPRTDDVRALLPASAGDARTRAAPG